MENKTSSLSSLINTYKAAVVFIDNGGTLESIPLEPQKLYALLNRYSYSKLKNLNN